MGQNKKRKKKKKMTVGTVVRLIILIVALVVFVISAVKLYGIFHDYQKTDRDYGELAETYTTPLAPEEQSLPDILEPVIINGEAQVTEDAPVPLQVDFDKLKALNPDIIGWIYMEALPSVSYPVVQGTDNAYYLNHTFKHDDLFSGSIFMDYQNSADFSDPVTFIYGHNMRNGSMFGMLSAMEKAENMEKSPYFWLLTPEGNYRYHIFALMSTLADGETYTLFSAPGQNVVEWAQHMKQQSEKADDVDFSMYDKHVVLSTCNGNDATRFVIIGKCVSTQRPPEKALIADTGITPETEAAQ
ncbi:MAG: class B sortase [Lachnospiraceae bacterium]|nr:class B sortase [Lachnospiraceae bacterium]